MKRFWSVLAPLLILLPSLAVAEEELTVKFYPLGELAQPPKGFRYSDGVSDSAPAAMTIQQGGQQGGGGTGYFSVPANALMPHQSEATALDYTNDVHGALVDLIVGSIDADSWEENGGDGTITAINDTLVIRQNATNHQATAEFLKNMHLNTIGGQPLKIELWWLPLDDAGRQNLEKVLAADDAVAKLNELSESIGGYHGQLNARNRVWGNLSSGRRAPLITGRIPVVAQEAVGIQPIVRQIHIGVTAEIKARIQESWEGDGIQLSLQTELTDMKEVAHCEAVGADIDRYDLGRYELATNVLCRPAALTIAGSLSAVGVLPEDEHNTRELTVVVQVSK